ncbi:hypothetical protein SAMN04488074_10592 [Lentzea albidocapillata subsp. violacea]|uniref:Uncharacterized protein n=1 Tax=Lentzea albidocapillata subsp. violacea TaxID=128104 RepID=A0A1G9ASV1_9PSEU|nr:hypothetical protein [Lentzea albidocapillata]SDK29665.1 hypothetical protein SAMN04488074_10592 [Lentzea albidocapillata subsp. violacea]
MPNVPGGHGLYVESGGDPMTELTVADVFQRLGAEWPAAERNAEPRHQLVGELEAWWADALAPRRYVPPVEGAGGW